MAPLSSTLCGSGRRSLLLASRRSSGISSRSATAGPPRKVTAAEGAPNRTGCLPTRPGFDRAAFTSLARSSGMPTLAQRFRPTASPLLSRSLAKRAAHSRLLPASAPPAASLAEATALALQHNPGVACTGSISKRGMMSKAGGAGPEGRGKDASGAGRQQQDGGGPRGSGGKDGHEEDGEYDDADYEPEPEGERIGPLKLLAGGCLLLFVVAAIGATVTELMPTHMAPQSIMSRAHDVFQADPDTANHFGTPLKVYGRDNHRQREGRRNFVEHVDHEDPTDGSKRTRVRFNVEGPNGHGMAYAEVSNKMDRGEWVYLCVQDLQTGHVITLHDNRALLLAQAQAGSDDEKNAFRKMLGQ